MVICHGDIKDGGSMSSEHPPPSFPKRLCLNVILSPFDTLRINSGEESRLCNWLKMRDASRRSA